jgi:hypothetical protein
MLETEPELKAKFEAWKAANPALLSDQSGAGLHLRQRQASRRTGMAPLSGAVGVLKI